MKRSAAQGAKDTLRPFDNDPGSPRSVLKVPLRPSAGPGTLPIRVVIADSGALMRDGLRALLSAEADFVVLGDAHDSDRAIALVQELRPDVLLLDASLTEHDGLDVLRRLKTLGLAVRTVLLTVSLDQGNLITALQLGARGFLARHTPTNLLFRCIRRVQAGEVWITREAVGCLVAALADAPQAPTHVGPQRDFGLTAREQDVLRLIIEGETNKGIAARLGVGPDTVKHHLTSIFDKTGASNRLELALLALHYSLVRPQA